MTDELREAIEWAREEADDGPWNGYIQRYLRLLADAAERSVDPPTITPEMIAALLPEWAAGMAYDPREKRWAVCKEIPEVGPETLVYGGGNAWSYLPLNIPAPAIWKTSWTPKPKPKLRCPWPGCDGWLFSNTDGYVWWMECDTCTSQGPSHPNEGKARASVEVKR